MHYFASLKFKPTIWVLLFSAFSSLYYIHNVQLYSKKDRVIQWDIISYYAYLPATFIYKDISLKFTEQKQSKENYVFWGEKLANGNYRIKTSMGLSMLYAPFFFVAHAYALVSDADAGGFSTPYKLALIYAALFFLLVGLIFLRKLLGLYFSENIVALVLLAIFFGTNLYFYTVNEGPMSHVFNFALLSMFMFYTVKWHHSPNWKYTIFLGVLSGIISLIRPINVLVALLFILYNFNFRKSIHLFLKHATKIFVLLFLAAMVWLPQLVYWRIISGDWFSYSYGNEGFFWLSPQIGDLLFSWRKGLFLYSPVLLFVLPGFYFMYREQRAFFWPITILFMAYVYVLSSWWSWWYGGSFGMRAMIDIYAILAIPLAFGLNKIRFLEKSKKRILLSFFIFFTILGVFHTAKYHYGSIHWDSMTKEALIKNYFKLKREPNFEQWIASPDYESAIDGKNR